MSPLVTMQSLEIPPQDKDNINTSIIDDMVRTGDCHAYKNHSASEHVFGGGRLQKGMIVPTQILEQYNFKNLTLNPLGYSWEREVHRRNISRVISLERGRIVLDVPVRDLLPWLTDTQVESVAALHFSRERTRGKDAKGTLRARLECHRVCGICEGYASVFHLADSAGVKTKQARQDRKFAPKEMDVPYHTMMPDPSIESPFPPLHVGDRQQQRTIIHDFCQEFTQKLIEEKGCAVCGIIVPNADLRPLDGYKIEELVSCGTTRKERKSFRDPIEDVDGPVLANGCNNICTSCAQTLESNKVPLNALCAGTWVGDVPKVLQALSFAEKMLVARIRHNRCVVRVLHSGRSKMMANAVMYASPIPKIYKILPPPRKDVEEVLACVFIGSVRPDPGVVKRTPLLVRRNEVKNALEWLKLNHRDYKDLDISEANLEEYMDGEIPVYVDFVERDEQASVNEDEGADSGCPFTVQGVTGPEYNKMGIKELKYAAVAHLTAVGNSLAVGQSDKMISMYANPEAYPGMFPWLFPYGLGGLHFRRYGRGFSESQHRHQLLMYHDKRFQRDPYFPMIAFSHMQMKAGSKASHVAVRRSTFDVVAKRLVEVETHHQEVLLEMASRIQNGGSIAPQTDAEKTCAELLRDVDYIGKGVQGSLTSKKLMRSEIWSLVNFLGAPSWFLTFSPADGNHGLCMYYSADGSEWDPLTVLESDERFALCASNPVAAARFFHFVVEKFVRHILGIGTSHDGLLGPTAGYYATVEQQGRLTLHLHMLLWIQGGMTPEELKSRMTLDGNFRKSVVEYLEESQQAEFKTGTLEQIRERLPKREHKYRGFHDIKWPEARAPNGYINPVLTLPKSPPMECVSPVCDRKSMIVCTVHESWEREFNLECDELAYRLQYHNCGKLQKRTDIQGKETAVVTGRQCLNKYGECTARFPRKVVETTHLDEKGHLQLRHLEPMVNAYNKTIAYLLRCNTDMTSLMSGTAIKAVIMYVTDYVSKPSLKTYQMFSTMHDVFKRGSLEDPGDDDCDLTGQQARGRKVLLRICNRLIAKMEIGSPMACLYMLGNPDHYTSHCFKSFWWRVFVNYVENSVKTAEQGCESEDCFDDMNRVLIRKDRKGYVPVDLVDDYRFRPTELERCSLYSWIQISEKQLKKNATSDVHSNGQGELRGPVTYEFDVGHPLGEEYNVVIDWRKAIYIVPTFFGGRIPRMNSGDGDYFYCVMATLFVPWRNGKDLKRADESWESSFKSNELDGRSRQIIKNFGIRDECADARDDYYRERLKSRTERQKSGRNPEIPPLWDDANDFQYMEQIDDAVVSEALEDGPRFQHLEDGHITVEERLRSAGWMKPISTIPLDQVVDMPFGTNIAPSVWRKEVANARENLLTARRARVTNSRQDKRPSDAIWGDAVRVVSADWFSRDCRIDDANINNLMKRIVAGEGSSNPKDGPLNREQERAFRMVANHAAKPQTEPLRMYLGGMGGTGKSRVLRAIAQFFKERDEEHRFVVVAPTGTAAALLKGSTYHYMFGFRPTEKGEIFENNDGSVLNAKERLEGVEYVFLDEVSMIGCRDLHNISSRLACAFGDPECPFGGLSVILAGDFAQLPPINQAKLWDQSTSMIQSANQTPRKQEETMGMLLWHQFTHVVILKKNMRQCEDSPEDSKLRTALENMRYSACTSEDVAFLETLVAHDGDRRMEQSRFQDVSIITGTNANKDYINDRGAERFSQRTGRPLHRFYATDRLTKSRTKGTGEKTGGARKIRTVKVKELTQSLRDELWAMPPDTNDKKIPAVLAVCKDMPVMLRQNEATELSMTKGQEGIVFGWDSSVGTHGKAILETLYVKLLKPPENIQLKGLPINVVPITKKSLPIIARLRNDTSLSISREQVNLHLNFAMTDYASQGKSRDENLVELDKLRTFMNCYTAISRSVTAAGTLLLGNLIPRKITGGLRGHLRQEFRELEILNEITMQRYEGILPASVSGDLRRVLIRSYRSSEACAKDGHVAGLKYLPESCHRALHYDQFEDVYDVEEQASMGWHATNKDGSKSTPPSTKRMEPTTVKERKKGGALATYTRHHPVGLVWDANDSSCGYDTLFTILMDTIVENRVQWEYLKQWASPLILLLDEYWDVNHPECSRDVVRKAMRSHSLERFPLEGVRLSDLLTTVQPPQTYGTAHISCDCCHNRQSLHDLKCTTILYDRDVAKERSLGDTLQSQPLRNVVNGCRTCCSTKLRYHHAVRGIPPFLFVYFNPVLAPKVPFDGKLTLGIYNDSMRLGGIIYWNGYHYTGRIIRRDGSVWYYDCQSNSKSNKNASFTGYLDRFSQRDLHKIDMDPEFEPVALIYTQL